MSAPRAPATHAASGKTLHFELSSRWYSIPILLCIALATGAALYCCLSYDTLAAWYLRLNPCIYKAESWQQKFFTPATKSAGNVFAIAGIFIAAGLGFYFVKRLLQADRRLSITVAFSRQDVVALSLLYLLGIIIWTWGAITAYPSYDEVFSLMNCARIHPLQTASYYMLPNNHVLFNLLNALPARFFSDGVISGRIISGIACVPLVALVYGYLRLQTGSRYIAAICCAVMMLQFVVWAFSVQARGYALYLSASWTSLIFLEHYLRRGSAFSLALHGLCIVVGCWTVPSFMLWEGALIAYAALHFIRQRKTDWPLVRTQLAAGALVYLVHLPILLFSGSEALTGNGYVKSNSGPFPDFANDAWLELRHLFRYAFADLPPAQAGCDVVLLLLPVLVYPAIRRARVAELLLFYIVLWLIFCIMELKLRHFPPLRGLVGHQSLSLAAILLALWAGLGMLLKNKARVRQCLMTMLCGVLAVLFSCYNYLHIQDGMYGYNLELAYKNVAGMLSCLPPATRLGTSPESFYPRYVCSLHGTPASECKGFSATMYVKRKDEPMPAEYSGRVQKVDSVEDYEVFTIRQGN